MSEIDCGRIFALLSEYLDRELPAATCDELEQHLRDCPQCIQFVRSLKRSMQLCRKYGRSRILPPVKPDVMAGLRKAYAEMLSRRRRSQDNFPGA